MSTIGKKEPREARLSSFFVYPTIMLFDMFEPRSRFHSPTSELMFSMIW